jgi:transcription elongation factor GreA-like protein
MSFCFLRNKQCKSSFLCNSFAFIRMKYIFFTDLRSSKKCQNYKKSFLREQRKFCRRYKKSFLRERSVSFLLKSRSKGNAEPNTAKIEGEEVQKTFLRGCRTYTAEIEGEEVQKTFLRGCRTYTKK